MFKNKARTKIELVNEEAKTQAIIDSTNNHFNRVQELLFSGDSLSSNKLLELKQLMTISGALASSRVNVYMEKYNNYIESRKFRRFFDFLSKLMSSSSFPLPKSKEKEFLKDKARKLKWFVSKISEFGLRYNNYNRVISSHLDKKTNESINETTADLAMVSTNTNVMIQSVKCINDFYDGNITLDSIPKELMYPISLILARTLDVEVSNLPELLALAKERVNQNTKERSRHQQL